MNNILSEFNLNEEQLKKFELYYDFLIKENKKYNLTGITEKKEVYIKHFYDSLLLSKTINLDNQTLLDVGAGAGFPSIPLLIKYPNLKVTIVDCLKKRINFLEQLKNLLNLKNLTLVHERIENYKYKNYFDIVTSRAVARLNILLELCIPFINKNGFFIPLKSQNDEDKYIYNALVKLNCKKVNEYNFLLPQDLGSRKIYLFKKQDNTNNLYPRAYNIIKKNPL